MCLAIPGKVLAIIDAENQLASVDVAGVPRKVNLSILPDDERAGVGDWVLIYTGFAMSKIDEQDALQTQQMLDGVEEAYERYAGVTAQIHDQRSSRSGSVDAGPGAEGAGAPDAA